MSLRSIVKSSGWLLISNIISRFGNIFTLAMLARILGPENLGSFNLTQQTVTTSNSLSQLGVDAAIHTNGAKHETFGKKYTGRLFGTGSSLIVFTALIISIFLWLFRFKVASDFFPEENINQWMFVVCLIIFFTASSNPCWLYLQAFRKFKLFSIRSSILSFLNFVVLIIMSHLYGLGGALYGLLIVSLITFIISIFLAKNVLRDFDIRLRFDKFISQSKSILKFGLPFYANNFLGGLISLPLLFYLGISTGIENVAYVRTAETFAQMISFIPIALSPVIISYLSSLTNKDKNQFNILRSLHFRITTAITFFICFISLLSVNFFLPMLFGKIYIEAAVLTKITLISSFFNSISSILSQYLISEGRTKVLGLTGTVSVLVFLGLALILIPNFGTIGFLIAKGFIPIFSFLIFSYLISKSLLKKDMHQSRNLFLVIIIALISNFLLSNIFIYNYSFLSLFLNSIILFSSLLIIYIYIFTAKEKYKIFLILNQKLKSLY